jgi:hypothetical protein
VPLARIRPHLKPVLLGFLGSLVAVALCLAIYVSFWWAPARYREFVAMRAWIGMKAQAEKKAAAGVEK